jgi:hypothetical protein
MAKLKAQVATAMRNIASQKSKLSLGKEDTLDKEIKKLESAAQTPFEKGKRRKRMQQSRAHRVS